MLSVDRPVSDLDNLRHLASSIGTDINDNFDLESAARIPQPRPVKILSHARIFALASVNAATSTFECRFDLYLAWPEQVEGSLALARRGCSGRVGTTDLLWEPSLRFPNAVKYSLDEKLYFADEERGRIGYRVTVQGVFKCVQNLKAFPFDHQGLQLVTQLGFEVQSKGQLYADDYQLVQNPEQPNLMFSQHDPEYFFRQPRVQATTTGPLEAAAPISKLIIVVPTERKYGRYLTTVFFSSCVIVTLGLFTFMIPAQQSGERMMVPALLMIALFGARAHTPIAPLPATHYLTWLEWYWIYGFTALAAVFIFAGTATENAGNITGAVACAIYWASCNAYAYVTAVGHMEHGPEFMGRFGKIDLMSQRLLGENGVRLNTWGTIADINKYQNLMNMGSSFETLGDA